MTFITSFSRVRVYVFIIVPISSSFSVSTGLKVTYATAVMTSVLMAAPQDANWYYCTLRSRPLCKLSSRRQLDTLIQRTLPRSMLYVTYVAVCVCESVCLYIIIAVCYVCVYYLHVADSVCAYVLPCVH